MELVSKLIPSQYAILVAVLYCLGLMLKAVVKFPNQFIPLTLTVFGIALACLSAVSRYYEYANAAAIIYDGVAQGILCTGMAVYFHEVLTKTITKNTPDNKDEPRT